MVKVVCKQTFPDGKELIGAVEARLPCTAYPIFYAGALDRLKEPFDTGTASDLELLFKLVSRGRKAKFEITRTGEHDRPATGG